MPARKPRKDIRRKTPQKKKSASAKKKKTLPKKSAGGKPKKKSTPAKTASKKSPTKTVSKKSPAKAQKKVRAKKTAQAGRSRLSPALKQRTEEEERRALLRKTLVARREAIVKEAKLEISKYIKGETRQLVDTALDDGDWSVVDLSEDVSLRQLGAHKDTLRKIDEALMKLNEGTYGICEDCGEEISEQRLKILPFAIYCTDCQERREQMEAIERSEGMAG